MFPPIRSQSDLDQDEYSRDTGVDFDPSEDMARQEGAAESDINVLMERFGVQSFQRPVVFQDVDYDLDLMQVYQADREMRDAWERLPAELQGAYRGWPELFTAVEAGEVTFRPDDRSQPPDGVPAVPPAPASADPAGA